MTFFSNILRRAAPVALALLGLATSAHAQDIENTASVRWRDGSTARQAVSNTVVQAVRRTSTPPVVNFMRRGGAAGVATPVTGGQCRTADGGFVPTPPPSDTAINPAGEPLEPATDFAVGEPIFVVVTDPDRNNDPGVRELSEITIENDHGDEEVLRLLETGPNTSVFAGYIPTTSEQPPIKFNCQLSLGRAESVKAKYTNPLTGETGTRSVVAALTNYVFDASTGAPVSGARITLVDEQGRAVPVVNAAGEAFPSTVVSGQDIVTGRRRVRQTRGGEFQFPALAAGRYRYVVQPPSGYAVADTFTSSDAAGFRRPDGRAYVIKEGSFADLFSLSVFGLASFDIPLIRLSNGISLEKTVTSDQVSVGDLVQYGLTLTNTDTGAAARDVIITDTLPAGFRYQADSARLNGRPFLAQADAAGRTLTFRLDRLEAGSAATLTYLLQVGPDARRGVAVNSASATAANDLSTPPAQAAVQVRAFLMTDAMTIIGRVSVGECAVDRDSRPGLAGVRLVLEDGTQVVTDARGAFHFEGVRPGLHVVQMDVETAGDDYELVDCDPNTRRAGRVYSQFVEGAGGALLRADFQVRRRAGASPIASTQSDAAQPLDDEAAAGAGVDWFADKAAIEPDFLFPSADHNPRAPSVRVAIRHRADQTVQLSMRGHPVDMLSFDGVSLNEDKTLGVSVWRALPLDEGSNALTASVLNADGSVDRVLERQVSYANTPARAQLVTARSRLVADGVTRPVIAVRFTDSAGNPVRAGTTGPLVVADPYVSAFAADLQQTRQLAGAEAAAAVWRVQGDDGIALIELAPTTKAGSAVLTFNFTREGVVRTDEVRAWLQADRESWIVVGFAAGTVGFNTLSQNAEALTDAEGTDRFEESQISFYAKGRIRGRWLLTMAYDSEGKETDDRGLLGQIDPDRYYQVYGDGAVQSQDAASQERLYVRLERGQFYALFGDFETGLDRTALGRYSRVLNGVQAVYEGPVVTFVGFAAMPDQRRARDEIQGDGLSGPYRLSGGSIVLNTEQVAVEIRDQFRSEKLIDRRELVRNVDYEIDYERRTLVLRRPLASRDAEGNPTFLVIDYETFSGGERDLVAGGRVGLRLAEDRVEAGATVLQENQDGKTVTVAAVDLTLRPTLETEIRIEAGQSRNDDGVTVTDNTAYRIEAEHHTERLDLSAYYRQQDENYGLEQQNLSDRGARKYGVDGRLRLNDTLSLQGALYRQELLNTGARRTAADAEFDWRPGPWGVRAGFRAVQDIAADGTTTDSRLVTLGVSRALLNRRLELTADTEFALGGEDASVDFPTRHRFGASFALTEDIRLVGAHEVTDGPYGRSSITRIGADVAPWQGGRLTGTLNQQAITEAGARTFGQFGLAQTLTLGSRWSVDAAFDASRQVAGDDDAPASLDPNQPGAAGGFIGQGAANETFEAISVGATYRADTWSWNGRLEGRRSASADRVTLISNVLRQLEDGVAIGSSLRAYRLVNSDGSAATLGEVSLSAAWRPIDAHWSILEKLEFRHDQLDAAAGVDNVIGALGGALNDVRSSRLINNAALNYDSGSDADGGGLSLSLYHGAKYVLGRYDDIEIDGFSQVLGLEGRLDLTPRIDVGFNLVARHTWQGHQLSYAMGPSVGLSLATNTWLTVGYNFAGFEDRDFSEIRYTRQGGYLTLRLRFDQDSLSYLTQALEGRR